MNEITITKYNGDIETIKKDFLEKNEVKFIFINKLFLNLSTNKNISEIHKLKSEYNSKRFILTPISVIYPYPSISPQIVLNESEPKPDGYMCISKLDVIKQNNVLTRYPQITMAIGKEMCIKEMKKYNNILCGEIYIAKSKLENGTEHTAICFDAQQTISEQEAKEFVINKNNSIFV